MTLAPVQAPAAPDTDKSLTGYAVVPNALLRNPELSDRAVRLYAVLDGRRATRQAGIRVGLATLAADLGTSESTVKRAAEELEEAGWLRRRRTGRTSAWHLANPVRKGGQQAVQAVIVENDGSTVPRQTGHERTKSLTTGEGGTVESSTPPQEGREGRRGQESQARSVTAERSDRSPVTSLQSITREDYNNTETSSQSARPSGAHGDEVSAGAAAKKIKSTVASDAVLAAYLQKINAATGAKLLPTPALRDLVQKIAARGIPADEAAMTAAAWLAVKGSKVVSPAGFLAAVALPSLAYGEKPEGDPTPATPIPPAYRDLSASPRCDHGAEAGRCALCRRQEATATPARLRDRQEDRRQEAAVREAWPAVLDALKASSRVAWMIYSESQPASLSAGTLAVNVELASKAKNAKASGHEDRLSQAIREATGLGIQVDTRCQDLSAAATGAPF